MGINIEAARRLSGHGFGEIPSKPKEKELLIPAFVNEDHRYKQARQWRSNVDEAQIGAVVGIAKKQARQYTRAERSKKQCIGFMILFVLILLLGGAIT